MKIRLLSSAFNDLADGRNFYERQGEGIGGYFLDSLFSDIYVFHQAAHIISL